MSRKPTYEELEQKVRALEGFEKKLTLANQKLKTLHSITSLKGADIQTISNHVLSAICKMTESRYGFYGFLDDDASDMIIYAWTDSSLKDCSVKDRPKHFPIKKAGVWAEAIRNEKAYILNDYESCQGKKGVPDGHVKINNLLVLPILKDGLVISVAAVANKPSKYDQSDITQLETFLFGIQALVESKQAEEKARESEKLLVNFVNNLPGTAYQFAIDTDGSFHFEYMGKNCIDLFGFSADEIMTDANLVFNLIPRPDADKVHEAIMRSAKSMTPYDLEHRVIKKNGETVWIHAVSTPCRRANGVIVWDGIGLDITEKKSAEESLLQSEKKLKEREATLKSIHRFAPVGIGILDTDRNFHWPNQKLTDITGYGLDELENMPSRKLYESEEEYLRVAEEKKENLSKTGYSSMETTWLNRDGQQVNVILSAAFKNPQNPSEGLVGTAHDITDYKKAVKALQENEERNRLLFENASMGIGYFTPDGKVVTFNERAVKNLSGRLEDYIGKSLIDIFGQDLGSIYLERIKKTCETSNILQFEDSVPLPSGDKWFVSAYRRIVGTNGDLKGVQIISNDITELKVAENALKESEKRFRNLYENAPLGYQSLDSDGCYIDVNPVWLEMMGYSRSKVIGSKFIDFLAPEEREPFKQRFPMFLSTGETHVDVRMIKSDGSKTIVHIDGTVGKDKYGKFKQTHCILQDITERKEAEKALIESEQKWRNILVNTPQIGISLDKQARIIFANDHFLKLTGWKKQEIIGQDWFDLFIPDKIKEEIRHVFLSTINQKDAQDFSNYENEIITKSGALKNVAWSNLITKNMQGEVVDVTCLGIDLTERINYEKLLKKKNTDLRLAQRIASIGTWTLDPEIGIPEWSDEIYRIYERDPKLGPYPLSDYKTIYKGKYLKIFNNAIQGAIKDGIPYDIELRLELPSGNVKWVHAICEPEPEMGPKGHKVRGTIQDITERKQTEEMLQEREERYRFLTENMADIVWTIDMNFQSTYVSPSVERLLGYSPEERMEQPFEQQVTPESLEHVTAKFQEELELEKTDSADPDRTLVIDIEFYHKDGSTVWTENNVSAIRDKSGKLIGLHGVTRDITDRKQAERKLKDSEERYRSMISSMSGIIFQIDENDVYIDVHCEKNREDLLYSPEELLGRKVQDVMPSHIVPLYNENSKATRNTGKSNSFEYSLKYEKNEKWYSSIFDLHRDGKSLIVRTEDVTERKNTEKALRESEDFLNRTGDMAKVGGWELDLNSMKVVWTRTTGRIHELPNGYFPDLEEAISYYHPEDQDHVRQCVQRAIESSEPFDFTVRLITAKGRERWVRALGQPIFDSGSCVRLSGTFQDITEHLKLEEELRQSQRMESIGNLAGGIAHDFNNILSSIIGFTELALDETSKGTTLEDSLQEIYSAGKRAKDLVKQILSFARQSEEKRSPIQPGMVAKEVLKFMRSTIPTTIKIEQTIESDSWVMGNSTQVHQVLMNLCTNAANAMEDSGGTLELSIRDTLVDKTAAAVGMRPGYYVEIKVSDTGMGIPPETIDSIFEPYFTTKGTGKGTGLGLAVAHGIIESYGGKITAESRLGKGATFTIHLPITKKRSAQDAYVPAELPTGTERILFVDDEAPIAKMGSQILERLGYRVTSRTSSIEALELFSAKPDDFDLVVTDMTMPNLTGDKLAVELMKIRQDIPVILCTGYSKKISDESAAEIGIRAFAYKPVVKADLAKTVRKVLDEAKDSPQA